MLRALALSVLLASPALADDFAGADKALHFAAAAEISLLGYTVSAALGAPEPVRWAIGGGAALAAGALKELLWDHALNLGQPSWLDFAWDAIGAAFGAAVAWLVPAVLATVRAGRTSGIWAEP